MGKQVIGFLVGTVIYRCRCRHYNLINDTVSFPHGLVDEKDLN